MGHTWGGARLCSPHVPGVPQRAPYPGEQLPRVTSFSPRGQRGLGRVGSTPPTPGWPHRA